MMSGERESASGRAQSLGRGIQNRLQVPGIDRIEGCRLTRVEIQNRKQLALRIDHGNDDFGSAARIAGDVTLEGVNVIHDLRSSAGCGNATHALIERDLEASNRSLVGSDAQQFCLDNTIEAYPARPGQILLKDSNHGCHAGDRIGYALQERGDLRLRRTVAGFLVDIHDDWILATR